MSAVEEGRVTNGVLAALNGYCEFPVYDHEAPGSRAFPYGVLYRIPGGDVSGPWLHDPNADITFVYQVDGVGGTREQAEWVAGQIGRALVGRIGGEFEQPLELAGSAVVCGRMRDDTMGGVEVEGLAPNRTFTVPNRYRISVTPS